MKHPTSIMVSGAMSAHGTPGLNFLQPGTNMNGANYLDLLKDKLEIHMMVHDCNVFMHDGASCHRVKSVKNFSQQKNVDILDWPGNNPDLNPIKSLWHMMKSEVADQYSTRMESLKKAIKIVWTHKMTSKYSCNLTDRMPAKKVAVVKKQWSPYKILK